jgi:general stress protein 26
MEENSLDDKLTDILSNQKFAVIATQGSEEPYTNLVAFVCTNDKKNLIFITLKNTKKYQNILNNSRMSMLFDNRDNTEWDIKNAVAITAIGSASEIKDKIDNYKKLYLEKHPYLADFVNSTESVLINLKVEKYIFVNRFQNVEIITP